MNWVYHLLHWIWNVLIFLPATITTCLMSIIFPHWLAYPFWVYLWSGSYLRGSWTRVEISGKEYLNRLGGSCIVVMNHESALDIYAIFRHLEVPNKIWTIEEGIFSLPLFGRACQEMGWVRITRNQQATQGIAHINQICESDRLFSMMFFPEGRRKKASDSPQEWHLGAFITSIQHHLPLLPVTIEGAVELLPREAPVKGYVGNSHPGTVRLRVHPPLLAAKQKRSHAEIRVLAETMRDYVQRVVEADLCDSEALYSVIHKDFSQI